VKKALIIVLLLVTMILGLPFADGFWVKKKYYHLNELVSQRTPLSLQIIDYQRGWFSSTATLKVSSETLMNNKPVEATPQESNHFIVKEKLYHGPFIFRSDKPFDTFGKSITWALALSEIHVNQDDLKLSTLAVYHYNGSVSVKFDCPTISYPIHQPGEVFGVEGLKGSFSFSKRFKHSQGEITVLAADIPLHNGHQIVKNATYSFSLDKTAFDLWQGKRSVKISDLLLNSSEKWQLHGVDITLSDNTQSRDLNSTLNTQIASFKINESDFGKQQFVFNIANLNLATLSELGKKADLLDQQSASISTRALELTPLALELLSDGLNLSLSSVDLNTKWGTIRGNASLDIAKQDHPHAQFSALLGNTTGQADFSFPAKLLQDVLELRYQALTTPQQLKQSETTPQALVKDEIDRWILAGWLIPNGDNYQVNIGYKTNQLLLNGKPIKIPHFPIPDSQSTLLKR
jgi:uncharacterized protein YdgA (DUF945 family)